MTADTPSDGPRLVPRLTQADVDRVAAAAPHELLDARIWVCGSREPKALAAGALKSSKRPICPATGRNARSNDAKTWGTFQQATKRALMPASVSDGYGIGLLGVNLRGGPWAGLDFDHVFAANGELLPAARDLLDALPATYTEVSPSGTGLRLFFCGELPPEFRGSVVDGAFGPGTQLEAYDGARGGRYLSVTGRVFEDRGTMVGASHEDLQPLVALQQRVSGAKTKAKNGASGARPQTDDHDRDVARARWGLLEAKLLDPDAGYNAWFRIGTALRALGDEGLQLWIEVSRSSVDFDEAEIRDKWSGMAGSSINSLFGMFDDAAPGWRDDFARLTPELPDPFAGEGATPKQSATEPEPVEEEPDEPEPEVIAEPDAAIPAGLLDGDNLLAATVRWIVESAPVPQPELALGAVLAAVGAVVGRRVETPTGVRTNVYSLNVAGTGCGKAHPQTASKILLRDAGLPWAIGPSEWKSDTALRNALDAQPSHVAFIDEFGDYLAAMGNLRAGSHLRGIATKLKEVSGIANAIWPGAAYADRKANPAVDICEPNLCVVGSTLPEKLANAITSEQVRDGLMNRCLLFVGRPKPPLGPVPDDDDRAPLRPPAELVSRWQALGEATQPSKEHIEHLGQFARRLTLTDEAKELRHAARLTDERCARSLPPDVAPLRDRFDEHLQRAALLHAVARDPRAETIEGEDITWAELLVNWCLAAMQRLVTEHVADSEAEAKWKRLLRLIEAAGPEGLSETQLARKAKWLTTRDRREVVAYLAEAGHVEGFKVPGANSRKPVTRCRAKKWKKCTNAPGGSSGGKGGKGDEY